MPSTFPITGRDGSTILIDATKIRSFRPTYGSAQPAGLTAIYFGKEPQFTPEAGDQLAVRLQGIIAPAQLTTPIGLPVWVDAGKVTSVYPSNPALHHPAARAVLTVQDSEQQVVEDVEAAGRVLAEATGVG